MTPVQRTALATIVRSWDVASANNVRRWGHPLAHGIDVVVGRGEGRVDIRSLVALETAGYVAVERFAAHTESLRRGSYGRWIGGSVRREYTTMLVKPTAAGRKALGSVLPIEGA